jgi:Zn-finger nucleic acid-binding protein
MARKNTDLFAVQCPCCKAELQIDPEVKAVISHKEAEKPKTFSDLEAAVSRFKGEADRREEAYRKSVLEQKDHQKVLDRKFDELFKKAKENPDEPPPKRDIDWD